MRDETATTSRRSRGSTAIDWAAVGGLVFDWVVTVGEYVFTVLLLGLAVGYFGTFADLVLYFVNESWVGRGREWGWVIGALGAAIGWPMGWVRRDGKKFSLPTPRQLRRRVSIGVRKRRKKKNNKSDEFRRLRDVLQCGGVLGLIGVVCGFLLGISLMMCWFSLAMSPLSPVEWFESIRWEAESDGHDRSIGSHGDRRPWMTSDHPIVVYAMFAPVVTLGGLGVVAGLLFGAVEYIRYLWTVPADRRAQQKWEKQQPVATAAEASKAAIEQKLAQLAPPPRSVPLRAYWQLLRGGVGIGLVGGGACVLVGPIFTPAIVYNWDDPSRMPLIFVTLIFVSIGLALFIGCLRAWRRRAYILRHGYLARCRIVACKGDRSTRWKQFDKAFDELYRTWHRPFATASDLRQFRLIGRVAVAMVSLFAVAFVVVLGFLIRIAWGEGWVFVAAIGILLLFAVVFFVFVFRFLRRFVSLGASPSRLGIKPIVDCRFEFHLPNGLAQQAEGKLDLQSRLDAGSAQRDEVAVYHPLEPRHALLLSSFNPGLEVGVTGQWQIRHPSSKRDAEPGGAKVYITPSGKSYHRQDCRFVGKGGSAVPLHYAQRYFEPCDVCQPPVA